MCCRVSFWFGEWFKERTAQAFKVRSDQYFYGRRDELAR